MLLRVVGAWKGRSYVSSSIINQVIVSCVLPHPFHLKFLSPSTTADHFHVHIVNANHTTLMGMTVGQAHMLDDIISLVRTPLWVFSLAVDSLVRR